MQQLWSVKKVMEFLVLTTQYTASNHMITALDWSTLPCYTPLELECDNDLPMLFAHD